MTNIPINAKVECTDGPCGQSTNVIVNPVSQKVTHLALHDKHLPDNPTRLVSVGKVASVTRQQIRLNCTKAEVAQLSPFIVTNFIQESASGQAYTSGAAYHSQYVLNDTAYDNVREKQIPAGELAIYSGMKMEAADGKAGKLDELVLDPESGDITHLLMREGHLWGKKDVAVPVSAYDFADGDTIYLKLDKKALETLPAVKVKR